MHISKQNEERRKIVHKTIMQVTDDKEIDWKQIKAKIEQGDIIYTFALALAKRRVDEYDDRQYDRRSARAMSWIKKARVMSYVLLVIYMCLSFFQKPSWCMEKPLYEPDTNQYYADCSGTVLEGPVIIVSTIPYLQNWQLALIEIFCVTFITTRKSWQHITERRKSVRYPFLIAVTLLVYLSDILQYIVGITFPFNQFLRPIYLIVCQKMIRRNLALYVKIFWQSKEIFIVIAGAFFFYVCIGRILFYQTPMTAPGSNNYDTFTDHMYNLYVTLTTSNYPDTMMPVYQLHRFSSFYWISYMGIVNFVLLNIILAYFYYHYKKELMDQATDLQRSKFIDTVLGDIDLDDPVTQRRLSKEAVDLSQLIDRLENSRSGTLHQAPISGSKWKRIILETLDSFPVKTVFALGSLLICMFVVVQSNEVSPSPQPDFTSEEAAFNNNFNSHWIVVLFILNWFALLDPLCRAICLGWRRAFKSLFVVFELLLSVALLIIISINLADHLLISYEVIKVLLILRLANFFRWIYSFEKYKIFFKTLFKMFVLFRDLLGVLMVVIYFYTTLAEVMFGGYLKTNSPINFSEYGDPEYYLYVNFNDFYMGLLVCFHIIVNNWLYTVDVHCRVMGSFGYRIFFVSYYFITVTICFNILIAFMLEIFITRISTMTAKTTAPAPTPAAQQSMIGDPEISESEDESF